MSRNSKTKISNLKRPSLILDEDDDSSFPVLNGIIQSAKVDNNRHEPNSIQELAVAKMKVEELKHWLTEYFHDRSRSGEKNKSPFLLLNGPTGCGKTITLKLLLKDLNIKFIELPTTSLFEESNIIDSIEPLGIEPNRSRINANHMNHIDSIKPLQNDNQMKRFQRFLSDFNRIKQSVLDENNDEKKVLVIEDIPSIFFVEPDLLHAELNLIVQKFKSKTFPIIFIISTASQGENVERKILPKSVQTSLNFHVITFKPITDFCLTKTLKKSSNGNPFSSSQIEEIVAASCGDIRHALNYLEFKFPSSSINHQNKHNKSRKTTSRNKKTKLLNLNNDNSDDSQVDFLSKKNNMVHCDRNESLDLMHSIGKILYAKRLETIIDENDATIHFLKNNPNCDTSKLRNPLKENQPENIAVRANISADNMIDWIHENLLDFIPDDDNLEHYTDCLQILDYSASNNDYSDGFSLVKGFVEELRSMLIIRGIMFNLNQNRNCYKKYFNQNHLANPEQKIKKIFRPLAAPRMFRMNAEINRNQTKLSQIKSNINHATYVENNEKNLVLDIFPALANIHVSKDSEIIRDFTKYLTDFEKDLPRSNNKKFFSANDKGLQKPMLRSFEYYESGIVKIDDSD